MEEIDFELYKKEVEDMPNDKLLAEYGEVYALWRDLGRTMQPRADEGKKGDMLRDEILKRMST